MEKELIKFLENILIKDTKTLLDNNQEYIALVIMSQSIETLGAFLDSKPFRAKAQSKKRFSLALKKLFPYKYRKANDKFFLYDKLRNHIAHILIPSSKIVIITNLDEHKHMEVSNGNIYIFIAEFYNDVKTATEELISMIENNKIRFKKLHLSDSFR